MSRSTRWPIFFLALWLGVAPSLGAQPSLDEAREHFRAGRLEEALTAFRALAVSLGEDDPAGAATAHNNACVVLIQLADYRAALAECEAALHLRRSLGDDRRLARALNNLGLVRQYLESYEAAAESFEAALDIHRRLGDVEGEVVNLSNLGHLATLAGRYGESLAHHAAAADLASRNRGEPWALEQIQVARANQGVALERVGAFREALEIYQLILAEEASSQLAPHHRAVVRVNLGVIYRNLGDPVRAVAAFEEAIAVFEALGDVAGLSNAWLNLGLARHLDFAQLEEAERAYRRALALAEQAGDRSEEMQDLFYLGQLLLLQEGQEGQEGQERLQEAEQIFARALAVAETAGSAEGRLSALYGLGRVAAARDRPQEALDLLRRAMDEVEQVRSSLESPALRGVYFGSRRPVYEATIALLAGLHESDPGQGHDHEALAVVQRAKARELIEAIGRATDQVPDPRLRDGPREGVVVEYFIAQGRLLRWLLHAETLELRDLGPSAPVLETAIEVHQALAGGREPRPADLAALSRTLLSGLGSVAGEERWRIAPDAGLRYLPFEILHLPEDPARLLVDEQVSYLPSSSSALQRDSDGSPPALTFLGFGNPQLLPPDGPAAPAALLVSRFGLESLAGAERELERVAGQVPGKSMILRREEATEAAFRRGITAGARIVHLATHTVVDEGLGRGAAVLLTPEGDDDGLLYPDEIAAVPSGADLTVLAACRTALGGDDDGRVLGSLTGSFLASGSKAVIATLWDIDDAAAAVFMEQLYYFLGRGEPPARALAQAKRRLRADPAWDESPLWAAYILVGDAPAVVDGGVGWIWGAGLVLIAVLAWGVAVRNRRRAARA